MWNSRFFEFLSWLGAYKLIAVRTKTSVACRWQNYYCLRVSKRTCLPLVRAGSSRAFRTLKWVVRGLGLGTTLHCTVIGFALDWESHKSLRRDRECLTELLERAFFQPYAIQRIQLAEVGLESDNKGFERKRDWVVCIESWATFSVLVWW